MWVYQKKLQYPVKITRPNPALAKVVISQFGGPDGEMGAATRYLSQRFSAPNNDMKGVLTDIGTEEFVPRCYIKYILDTFFLSTGSGLRLELQFRCRLGIYFLSVALLSSFSFVICEYAIRSFT